MRTCSVTSNHNSYRKRRFMRPNIRLQHHGVTRRIGAGDRECVTGSIAMMA